MKEHIACLALAAGLAGGSYYLGTKQIPQLISNNNCTISEKRCALRTDMRKMWAEHVWLEREYLITSFANLPEVQVIIDNLMRNASDISQAMAPYYGKEASSTLTTLLKDHILISFDVATAARANDKETLKNMDAKWHANADDIAAFLSNANPYWKLKEMKEMMHKHLKLITNEVNERIDQDWNGEIKAAQKVLEEMMMFADMLTSGIVQQFPDKF